MFRSIMLAALTGVLFLTSASTFARPAMSKATNDVSANVSSDTVVDDDGPGLGGGY